MDEFVIMQLIEKLQPFIKRILYELTKASLDTQLSLNEASRLMGVNRDTLKKRCQRGNFPHVVKDGVYYISKMDVNLYVSGSLDKYSKTNKDNKYKERSI